MSGGTVIAGGITVGMAASGVGTALGIANGINGLVGGGGSAGGGSGSGQQGGGGLNTMQTQFANSVHLNEGPKFGGSKEPSQMNPDMPLQPTKAQPEKAASKWAINSTPTQAVGEQQASQDANSIWADRLNKYLDYSTRQLG